MAESASSRAHTPTPALPPTQTTGAFWQTWKDFEVRHGNEDTIKEMLRIRRSVQATYNTQVNFMASQMLKVSGSATGTGEPSQLAEFLIQGISARPDLGFLGLGASDPDGNLLEGWAITWGTGTVQRPMCGRGPRGADPLLPPPSV